MFNEEKSEAFRILEDLCSVLKTNRERIGREVSCAGVLTRKGKVMTLSIEAFPDEMEETIELWLKVFRNLERYIEESKDIISRDFLPIYREDDDSDVTEEEFKKRLSIENLSAYRGHVVALDFSDDG